MAIPEEFEAVIPLLAMAFIWRLSYELSRPKSGSEQKLFLYEKKSDVNSGNGTLTVRQREWAAKAVRRYAEAQEKKWRKWNEAMFELE